MTLIDIDEFYTGAVSCQDEQALMRLFEEAGEDIETSAVHEIFSALSSGSGCELAVSDEAATLYGRAVQCPKCKNTSVYTLLGSAAEVLLRAETAHFGCCECGTQFELTR